MPLNPAGSPRLPAAPSSGSTTIWSSARPARPIPTPGPTMKSDTAPVAIIGGGFSGTALAAELTRRGVPVVLIEGGGRAGLGTAYATREPVHVLNVRAAVMSARADDPDPF